MAVPSQDEQRGPERPGTRNTRARTTNEQAETRALAVAAVKLGLAALKQTRSATGMLNIVGIALRTDTVVAAMYQAGREHRQQRAADKTTAGLSSPHVWAWYARILEISKTKG